MTFWLVREFALCHSKHDPSREIFFSTLAVLTSFWIKVSRYLRFKVDNLNVSSKYILTICARKRKVFWLYLHIAPRPFASKQSRRNKGVRQGGYLRHGWDRSKTFSFKRPWITKYSYLLRVKKSNNPKIHFSIENLIANISFYALRWLKLNFVCYLTFEISFISIEK